MEALKIKKPERTPAQQAVPEKARAVKALNDDARKAEKEKAKAEKRFDKALEVLQALKMVAPPEAPAPAPKKKRVAPAPPPPPPDPSEEDYSSDDDTPVEKAKPPPKAVINVQRRQIVFC